MLRVTVTNARERQEIEHEKGPLEMGRGPQRADSPRCTVQDPYVSKDHVRIEELDVGLLRIENLSTKQPIWLSATSQVPPGGSQNVPVPVRFVVGDTTVDIESEVEDTITRENLQTIAAPFRDKGGMKQGLLHLGGTPSPEMLMHWFETVITVQRATPGSAEFFDMPARALVELVDLDRGLVLVRNAGAWKVQARSFKDDGGNGREFSSRILTYVMNERRTFFQGAQNLSSTESLAGVQSVVASPIFGSDDAVIGVLYGSRARTARSRDIGSLEAQLVQLLASAVGIGLSRSQQEAEANRLRVAKEAAEQADRTKSQFLATMSHELRTPLNAIIGYSELLTEMAQDDSHDDYLGDLGKISGSAKHLLALINDVLDLSKIESGRFELYLETFDLGKIVEDVIGTVRTLADKNNNRLDAQLPENLGSMTADVTRIRQCLLNLLSNACKFTHNGAVTLNVVRQNEQQGEMIYFRIRDTGIGISPDQMKKLFQAFSQADASTTRKFGGTGLGLVITRKFCQMMGGDVTVDSVPNQGSTFTMVVPAKVVKIADTQ